MASLSLKHIFKVYDGNVKAVNDFNMHINDKEFIVFVGPSGCGKSTTLRMIAGLEEITAGELRIDNVIVNDYEPKDRNIAMVFQNYALYPHMTVYDNIAFSLRTAHVPKDIIYNKIMEVSKTLGITEYLNRKPKQLSGGQRQRVALGRAIVRNPKVFLLDEPLSNLDAKLRNVMRSEIMHLYEKLGTTFIYVTHDQVEAMTMGTRIVVMKDGCIQQIDTPLNIYEYPENIFVASFIGSPQMNFLEATIEKNTDIVYFNLNCNTTIDIPYELINKVPIKYMNNHHKVILGIRPNAIRFKSSNYLKDDLCIDKKVVVKEVETLGGEIIVYANLNLNNIDDENGLVTIKSDMNSIIRRGDIIDVQILRDKIYVFDKKTEINLKRKIPKENIIKANIVNNNIFLENQCLKLPSFINVENSENIEISIPLDAITMNDGICKGILTNIEKIENQYLYTIKIDNQLLFVLEDEKHKYNIGDYVNFQIDLSRIKIEQCNIFPLPRTNKLACSFIKIKKEKKYEFYLKIGNNLLHLNSTLCKKIFAYKEHNILNTLLECEFESSEAIVTNINKTKEDDALIGYVKSVLDYKTSRYAIIDIDGQEIVCKIFKDIGNKVAIKLKLDDLIIKDTKNDIIITY